jgi:hypothetical protein
VPFDPYSVVAVRNAASTKRQLHEQQQTTEHSKYCRVESEPQFLQAQEYDAKSNRNNPVSHTGELAEGLDFTFVVDCHGRPFHLEIQPIQK